MDKYAWTTGSLCMSHLSELDCTLTFGTEKRYFGTYRAGSNLIPDDIAGLPSTHISEHLASNMDVLLYEAEIDHGYGFRFYRPEIALFFCTPYGLAYMATHGCSKVLNYCTCDQACCWLRKEYSTRRFYRVYPNRIVINEPALRIPYGLCECQSKFPRPFIYCFFSVGSRDDSVSTMFISALFCNSGLW